MASSASQRCTSTQTAEPEPKEVYSVLTQTDFKVPPVAKTAAAAQKKTKDAPTVNGKEDAHLMATLRGMRVDLAIKEKAMQRLTRELDECKKTMKKLQKDGKLMN